MKKTTIFFALIILLSISGFAQQGGDWRTGKWHRNFQEHLLIVHASSNQTATSQSITNPYSIGFNIGYQNRVRPYNKRNQVSLGWGVYSGVLYYPGLSIKHAAVGATEDLGFGRYKSYAEVPFMASATMYITTRPTSSFFFELDAGCNMMLGQKDFAKGQEYVYVQKEPIQSVRVSHFVPTARFLIGFMTELAPNLRFRGSFGVQYEFGYTDHYSGILIDDSFTAREITMSNDPTISTVIELGIAYSL